MKLRPYQHAAVDAVFEQWQDHDATLGVAATGLGKTVIFGHVISRIQHGRVMVLAHREELITQAAEKIQAITGERPDIEMADNWADNSMFHKSHVVVSSIQTQISGRSGMGRMSRFKPGDFAAVIIDEAHHAPATSYQKVIEHYRQNSGIKILGVTATPDRADEAALGKIFTSVAFDYDILFGINEGWLVPIRQRTVTVDGLDYSKIRTTAGDLNGSDLAEVMEQEKNLHEIAKPTIDLAAGRKTLVFAVSVAHAERLCEIFNRYVPNSARWISGNTPKDERRHCLDEYAAGGFQFLCNVGVFTEGFDEPSIQCVVMARPTKSRSLFCQMVGRGTRPLPGLVDFIDTPEQRREAIQLCGKPHVDVIDFVGNAGKHKLVCTADILGGNYDDAVVAKAKAKAEAKGEHGADILEELEEALKEQQAEKERQRAERMRIMAERVNFTTQTIDPFDILNIAPWRERGWHKNKPVTDNQRKYLERHGIEVRNDMTFTKASCLIVGIKHRKAFKQCTFRQAKVLARYGFDTSVTKTEASQIISNLPRNRYAQVAHGSVATVADTLESY